MRAMDGFPPDEKVYYLPRSGLQPPENLLKSIFPTIDDWHWKLKNGVDVEHNFALDGYLRMLFFFCEVIIQDAAVMIDHHPNIIFQHPLFSTDDFLNYKDTLNHQVRTTINPIHQEIKCVMPELCRQIAASNESMTSNIVNAINNAMQELADNRNVVRSHTPHTSVYVEYHTK